MFPIDIGAKQHGWRYTTIIFNLTYGPHSINPFDHSKSLWNEYEGKYLKDQLDVSEKP